MSKFFAALFITLKFLYNYFDPTKLFLNLYLAKFLATLIKSFFRVNLNVISSKKKR